jgi:hypothetical protein
LICLCRVIRRTPSPSPACSASSTTDDYWTSGWSSGRPGELILLEFMCVVCEQLKSDITAVDREFPLWTGGWSSGLPDEFILLEFMCVAYEQLRLGITAV